MRVVIGEDQALLREGIVRLLEEAGFEVVGQAGDATTCGARSAPTSPTSRWSTSGCRPERTDDGLRAAIHIRSRSPPRACSCSRSTSRSATRST